MLLAFPMGIAFGAGIGELVLRARDGALPAMDGAALLVGMVMLLLAVIARWRVGSDRRLAAATDLDPAADRRELGRLRAIGVGAAPGMMLTGGGLIAVVAGRVDRPILALVGAAAVMLGVALSAWQARRGWPLLDDYERRLTLSGIAVGGTLAGLLLIGWATLAAIGRAPSLDPLGVVAILLAGGAIGQLATAWRGGLFDRPAP